MEYPILKYFEYEHLSPGLQQVSKPFCDLAYDLAGMLPLCNESEMALRKLLEAKDCAVRSALSNTLHIQSIEREESADE